MSHILFRVKSEFLKKHCQIVAVTSKDETQLKNTWVKRKEINNMLIINSIL